MTHKTLIAAVVLSAATIAQTVSAQPTDLRATGSVWGGALRLDPDNTDAQDRDTVFGLSFGADLDLGDTLTGALTVLRERSLDVGDDGDQTVYYEEVSFGLGAGEEPWHFGVFGGTGRTQDNGDDGGDIPYHYGGLAAGRRMGDLVLGGRLGLLSSDDNFGETIERGRFAGLSVGYDLTERSRIGAAADVLTGDRYNGTTPNDNQVLIRQASARFEHDLPDLPLTAWIDGGLTDYSADDETDAPWVGELRFGLTYAFGGGADRRPVVQPPRIGRWVSISANEME